MTPLQKVAMGLVIVVVDAVIAGFDAVPDVLGWLLVLLGLFDLRTRLNGFGTLVGAALVSAVVSVVLIWPGFSDLLDESAGWFLSLPQLVFSFLLCGSVGSLIEPDQPGTARRLSRLRWVFVALVIAPALLYGGRVDALLIPLAVVTVAANVVLIYLLFKVSKQPEAVVGDSAA